MAVFVHHSAVLFAYNDNMRGVDENPLQVELPGGDSSGSGIKGRGLRLFTAPPPDVGGDVLGRKKTNAVPGRVILGFMHSWSRGL